MTTGPERVPPSRELLDHHLKSNFARIASQGASRADIARFIGSLGEGWR